MYYAIADAWLAVPVVGFGKTEKYLMCLIGVKDLVG
jgi:hypothetical protein